MDIELKKEHIPLIIILFIGVSYIYLASMTPMLGEDEASYFMLAKDYYSKGDFPVIREIGQPMNVPPKYPPLLPLFFVPFFLVFGSTLGVAKSVVAIFGLLTLLVTYLVGKRFGWITGLAAVIILLSIPLFTHYMFISYTEIPIAFFSILSMYLFLRLDSKKKAIFTGIVLGLSFYVKFSGLLLAIAFLSYAIIKFLIKKDKKYLKLTVLSCIIFAAFVSPWAVRNILLYDYPYLEGLNMFYQRPPEQPQWILEAVRTLSPRIDYISTFGYVSLFLWLFGTIYIFFRKKKELYLPIFLFIFSILLLSFRQLIGLEAGEPRYFSLIFPQLALVGGYFLKELYKKNKYLILPVVIVLLIAIYSSAVVAANTVLYQRYSDDYVQSLQWVKDSTEENSLIFTAYGGSLKVFGERDNVWGIDEFPQLMTTDDPEYIYKTLKQYNVTHILIWRAIIANDYIVPESNLIGAFTYEFVNTVYADEENFELVYQNENNAIFELK